MDRLRCPACDEVIEDHDEMKCDFRLIKGRWIVPNHFQLQPMYLNKMDDLYFD